MEALPQMAWIRSSARKILYFNKAWYYYTGMKPGQTERWVKVLHPEDPSQVIEAWNKSLQAGDYHIECRVLNRENDAYNWFPDQAMLIRDENGKSMFWFGTYTEINDDKQDLETL